MTKPNLWIAYCRLPEIARDAFCRNQNNEKDFYRLLKGLNLDGRKEFEKLVFPYSRLASQFKRDTLKLAVGKTEEHAEIVRHGWEKRKEKVVWINLSSSNPFLYKTLVTVRDFKDNLKRECEGLGGDEMRDKIEEETHSPGFYDMIDYKSMNPQRILRVLYSGVEPIEPEARLLNGGIKLQVTQKNIDGKGIEKILLAFKGALGIHGVGVDHLPRKVEEAFEETYCSPIHTSYGEHLHPAISRLEHLGFEAYHRNKEREEGKVTRKNRRFAKDNLTGMRV